MARPAPSPVLWALLLLLLVPAPARCEPGQPEKTRSTRSLQDRQPRITSERGSLVFRTDSDGDIEFRTGFQGRIKVNDRDLGTSLLQIQGNAAEITEFKRVGAAFMHNVSSRLSQLQSRVRRRGHGCRLCAQAAQRRVCSSNPCQNGGTCLNLLDSFFCLCPPSWKGPVCSADVNECETFAGSPYSCQNGATCVNTAGSYSCTCLPDNYGPQCASTYNGCQLGSLALCGHGFCEDLAPQHVGEPKYRCVCAPGWAVPPGSSACTADVDECSLPSPPCSQNPPVQCHNTFGSFYCGPCPAGWQGNGHVCHDVNECEIANGGCSTAPKVQCTNTAGSYLCGPCPPGYQGDGKECTPEIICSEQNGGCHPDALCFPSPGVRPICVCRPGYTGDGYGANGCVPLSTICESHPCVHGQCTVTSGYQCTCNSGWGGPNCTENINECLSSPCLHGGSCTDGIGGYTCECTNSWTGPRCETPQQACGGSLSGMNGTFSYPNNPGAEEYDHNITCSWVLRTEVDKVLRITFPFFQLEASRHCQYDYLQIHDGDSSSAYPLGKFCGSNPPAELFSSHSTLYFLFHSDHSVSAGGFTVRWESRRPECGGMLSGSYGSISSPGYPNTYPSNRDCIWVVIAKPGLLITFAFGILSLEHHRNCSFDYLQIQDGPLPQDPILGKYCSSSLPPPLQTTGPMARVRFHSDASIGDRGFHITYVTSPADPGCGGNYTDGAGVITSPDWPNSYISNRQCVYVIRQPPGELVHLNVTHVELEGREGCSHSYIEVRDAETLLRKICGNVILSPVVSISNSIWVRFKSDPSAQKASFRATYQVACGGELSGTGTLQSPYYPRAYPHPTTCEWIIRQPLGQEILLNFLAFRIAESPGCGSDYVEIGNGSSVDNLQGRKYCGTDIPALIKSTSNFLRVTFRTSSSLANLGFKAEFWGADLVCGEILTAATGTIQSPGHPNPYPHGVNCTWFISVTPGLRIRLSFSAFHLDFHYNCTTDYLLVYDNGTGTTIGRFCGKSVPPSLTSSDNMLTLFLVTDSDLAFEGFAASYVTINASTACIENHEEDMGVLTSPLYPNHYPNNWECIYTITVGTAQQIALVFTNFSLEPSVGQHCVGDFVEIRDGGYETSPLLGKYCGTQKPPPIISHSNRLWIKFKSDVVISGPGFSAHWDGSLTGCGGNLTTSQGSFTSPNYPMPYYHQSECSWKLQASRGSPFELQFVDFHLQEHPNCSSDYLAVYDGPTTRARLLAKLCGDQIPSPIRSSGDSLSLKLRTDEDQQGAGFLATYRQVCQGVVIANQSRGTLESIHFPLPYPQNERCNWSIQAPAGNAVNYTFSTFDLEDSDNCLIDYVELYDGPNRIGRFCGRNAPPPGGTTQARLHVLLHTDGVPSPNRGFQMQWSVHGCGGELSGARGSLESPGYPDQYPASTECIWHITTTPGSSILLTLQDFNVEYHPNCNFDVLEVYGGPDFRSPRLAQLCFPRARENPLRVSSTGNALTVRFKTDRSVSGRGFAATWQEVPGGCGGNFQVPRGEIHSPNYPHPYGRNSDCSWIIQVDGGHHVLLNFTDFDLDPQDSCVEVYDGPHATSELLLHRCGQQLPDSITSSGNTVVVRFQSGQATQHRGFWARFTEACGSTIITASSGAISSPTFPARHPSHQNCSWVVRARHPFNHISLSFTAFDLEGSVNCSRDSVEVLDGASDDAPVQGRYCGSTLPAPVTSFSNSLIIRFVSYSILASKGFRAVYEASSSACGGAFHVDEGVINSPGYPDPYPTNTECVWTILSSPGNQFQLSFVMFQLEQSQDCHKDFLEIREGNATGHPVGRFCGGTLPRNYSSTLGHILWLRFVSDGAVTGRGFQAAFAHVFGNDNIMGSRGLIASPLWPQNYPHNSDYRWTVNGNSSSVVHGTIQELDVEMSTGCYYDKLSIHDGPSIHSRLIGSYCGFTGTTFASTGPSITFHFLSDSSRTGRGFLLEWHLVAAPEGPPPTITPGACGGVLRTRDSPAFFFSPGWPGDYRNGADCTWLLHAPDSTVELNVLSLDLESHQTCNYDQLVIRDGDTNRAPLLATLCGRDLPGPIRSTGDFMFVRFTTDSSITGAGFNASFHQSCGGLLHVDRGVITSPNYPDSFPPNLNCSWHVKVREGLTVGVHFEQPFQIPNGDLYCSRGDYLELRNGPDASSPPLGPSRGNGRLCGNRPPSSLFTTDNQMLVRFVSDSSGGGQGFKVQYEAKSLACGGTIYVHDASSAGSVSSPGYPSAYPQHADCTWTISVSADKVIELQFEDPFHVGTSSNCSSSYLELRDGADASAPPLARLCGTTRPARRVSSGSTVRLRFRSDDSSPQAGFRARISIALCGGTVAGQSGVAHSPGFPALSYEDNLECEWHLQGPAGHYLTITFEALGLQNSTGCTQDFVELRESGPSGPVLGRYCGSSVPGAVGTAGNVAFVKFVTDGSVGGPGFQLRFQASTGGCGGDLVGPTGSLASPGSRRPHRRICEWRVTAPEGRRVALTFHDLSLEGRPGCSGEYVIFNGIRRNSPQLQRLCGQEDRGTRVVSSGNTMKVLYFTDGSGPGRGFGATYTSAEDAVCGGRLSDPLGGNVTSPGYDGISNYSSNLNCEWILSNPNRHNSSIYISLDDFHLEPHQDCHNDLLEFRVGDAEGPLIWKLCGHSVPSLPFAVASPQIWMHLVTDERGSDTGFHAHYSFTDCGGVQSGEGGVIASPNFPAPYGNVNRCSWLLNAPPGHTITLTFTSFDIESHRTCSWDSVTVINGGSPGSPVIGRFCGATVPGPIQSGANQLVVIFNSDHSVQGGGFRATWTSETSGCGGFIHSASGVLHSPRWPRPFPENSRCTWTVITHESQHLELSFHGDFHIPSRDGRCEESHLKVWAGTPGVGADVPLVTACDSSAPGPTVTPRNQFTAVFQAREGTGSGFSLTFLSRCGANFTAPTGYVVSPNYPGQYDNNLRCNYVIEAEPRAVVLLQFITFQLEAPSARGGGCINDGLKVIRGRRVTSVPFATLCGHELPQAISFSGPMLLSFYTDSQTADFGFEASYRVLACGGTFNASFGTIRSPAYALSDYPNNMDCTYLISVRDGKVVELKFNDFNLEASDYCSADYVAVRDGLEPGAPLLGKFCGSELPARIRSSGDHLRLEFRTNFFQGARGWRASFRETLGPQHGCGGYLTRPGDTFGSPDTDSDGRYDRNLDCVWTISVPPNGLINLTFTVFALEDATARGCLYDYVKLYDGASENASLVGEFCGSSMPASFLSGGNFLTVKFVSDGSLERPGFNATYATLDLPCGGTYNATSAVQTTRSPRVLGSGLSFPACTWVVDAPPRRQVKVAVREFRLRSENCAQNFLQLRDSYQSLGRRFCGQDASAVHEFYSSGRTAVVVFRSDVFDDDNGVTFTYQVADCNREYSQGFGSLRSPGWPAAYSDNLDCVTVLRAAPNDTIALFFHSFAVEPTTGCQHDFLEVRNGSDEGAPLLGRYCGTELPNPIFPRNHVLRLRFKSDVIHSRSGYQITWTSSPSGCGGPLSGDTGSFASPGYPGSYSNGTHCEWTITAPAGSVVTVRFDLVSIDDPGDCVRNYLILYDGPDADSASSGPFCGADTDMAPFVAASHRVFVLFHAEYVVSPSAFRLSWTS
uniref:Cubilin n=1 Tax=Ornithorhynchus anatinus TaxID=9258 RepID=F7D8H4_ORNAN